MEEEKGYGVSLGKIREVLETKEFIKDYYLKRDELLFNAKLSQGQSFSKYTFGTAAVSLSASLTLVKLLNSPAHKYLLICAWVCFALAVFSSLLSILASMNAMEQQMKQMIGKKITCSIGNVIGSCVNYVNIISLFLIVMGLLLVITFSYYKF